jgi:transcriptional regulator with XRE-family HTH domain
MLAMALPVRDPFSVYLLGHATMLRAERAGLSVHTVQKLEAGGSHPYRDTSQRLALALGLSPADLVAFQAAAQPAPRRRGDGASKSSPDARQDLPAALTSFIGREREIDEITQQLQRTARLVTLSGVGGCGKTRLVKEVDRRVADAYPDGVWLVELASLADAALVPQAVATTLGIREIPAQPLLTTLTTALKRHKVLLLLDNCEHLLDACAHLANALLMACPTLQILATSREALGLTGEVNRRVLSLPVPPLDPPPTIEHLGEYAAVQLFVERARAVQPAFAVTDRNVLTIAQVCNRLDGIPLVLELAAALVRGLSVEDLAGRLDQRFRLLTGGSRAALPRQQTWYQEDRLTGLCREHELMAQRAPASRSGGRVVLGGASACTTAWAIRPPAGRRASGSRRARGIDHQPARRECGFRDGRLPSVDPS